MKQALVAVVLAGAALAQESPGDAADFDAWRARLDAPPIAFRMGYTLDQAGLGIEPGPLDRPAAELVEEGRAQIEAGEDTLENWSLLAVGYARTQDPRLEEAWAHIGPLLLARMEADPGDVEAMLTASSMLEEYALFGGGEGVFQMALEHLDRTRAIDPDSAEVARRLARLHIYSAATWHADPEAVQRGMQYAREALLAEPDDLQAAVYLAAGFMDLLHLRMDAAYGGHGPEAEVPPESVSQVADWMLELAAEVPAWTEGLEHAAVVRGALEAALISWSQAADLGFRARSQADGVAGPADESRRADMALTEVRLMALRKELDASPTVRAGLDATLWALRSNASGELADAEELDAALADLGNPWPWVELRVHLRARRGELDEAEALLTKHAELGEEARVALLRGKLQFLGGEYAVARASNERVLELGATEAGESEALQAVAFCDLALGEEDDFTLALLAEAVESDPAQPANWFALAVAQALAGGLGQARVSAQRAVDGDPGNATYGELVRALEPMTAR